MTWLTLPNPIQYPAGIGLNGLSNPSSLNYHTIDHANEKVGYILCAPKDGNISKIYFYISSITTGSDLRIAVETLTNGRPSGTDWGTNTSATLSGYSVGGQVVTLTSSASVQAGDLFAIVIDWDSSTGNIRIGRNAYSIYDESSYLPASMFCSSTSVWTVTLGSALVGIEYDDGSHPSGLYVPQTSIQPTATSITANTDVIYGNKFVLPFKCKVSGAFCSGIEMNSSTSALTVVVYDSNRKLMYRKQTSDSGFIENTGTSRPAVITFFDPIELDADEVLYVGMEEFESTSELYNMIVSSEMTDSLPGEDTITQISSAVDSYNTPTIPTSLDSGYNSSPGTTQDTASVTLTAGKAYLLGFASRRAAGVIDAPTITGNDGGSTWEVVADGTFATLALPIRRTTVWKVKAASSETGVITFTTSSANDEVAWFVLELGSNIEIEYGVDYLFTSIINSLNDTNTTSVGYYTALTANVAAVQQIVHLSDPKTLTHDPDIDEIVNVQGSDMSFFSTWGDVANQITWTSWTGNCLANEITLFYRGTRQAFTETTGAMYMVGVLISDVWEN